MESSEPSSPVALPMPTFQERRATTHAPPPPTPEAEHTETIRFAPELTENIQTCARVRPAEGVHAVTVADGNRIELNVKGSAESKAFTFDFVGAPATTQEEVFKSVARPLADACLASFNATIMAYGQTGAGKTYTMMGPAGAVADAVSDARGLTPRSMEYLFARMAREERRSNGSLSYHCTGSYLEVYMEHITDLLEPPKYDTLRNLIPPPNLQLREGPDGGVYVEGLTQEELTCAAQFGAQFSGRGTHATAAHTTRPRHRCADDALRCLERGVENRKVASTEMNAESSRSHAVFTLSIRAKQTVDGVTTVRHSMFNLVDLAGSERVSKTGATGQNLKEGANINKSLSELGASPIRPRAIRIAIYSDARGMCPSPPSLRQRDHVARVGVGGEAPPRGVPQLEADLPAQGLTRRQREDLHGRVRLAVGPLLLGDPLHPAVRPARQAHQEPRRRQ